MSHKMYPPTTRQTARPRIVGAPFVPEFFGKGDDNVSVHRRADNGVLRRRGHLLA
jgi:hypothetical protein